FRVTLSYSGTTLTETITDTVTGVSFTTSYTGVNIAALVGSDVAYVGFGGGTGGLTTVADIQTWTYRFASPVGSTPTSAKPDMGSVPHSSGIPDSNDPWPPVPAEAFGIGNVAQVASEVTPGYAVPPSAIIANPPWGASGSNPEARMSPAHQLATN